MSPRSKKEYTEAIHLRFKDTSRHEKTIILNEFCTTCGYHRKHAMRFLRGFKRFTKPKLKKRGKPPLYHNEEILKPLKQIWLAANLLFKTPQGHFTYLLLLPIRETHCQRTYRF